MKSIIEKINYSIAKRSYAILEKDRSNLGENFRLVGFLSDEKLNKLEEIIGFKINNPAIYEQALTHRSYQHVHPENIYSNERLEFLGDAILEMIISKYLFLEHYDILEGELTKIRSWIVNKTALATAASTYKLENLMLLSYSAQKEIKNGSISILADVLEAIIAAIFLDKSFEDAEKFVLEKVLPIVFEEGLIRDNNYKSILLEMVQSQGYDSPVYQLIDEKWQDKSKSFHVAVVVNDNKVAEGLGKSKKEAEQNAAKKALNHSLFSKKKDKSRKYGKANI